METGNVRLVHNAKTVYSAPPRYSLEPERFRPAQIAHSSGWVIISFAIDASLNDKLVFLSCRPEGFGELIYRWAGFLR